MSSVGKDKTDQALVTADATAKSAMPDPVFLNEEDPAAYQSMLDQVRAAVKPSDFVEEAWVRDVVDLLWESIRFKRLKAALINAETFRGLLHILQPLLGYTEASDLAERWFRKDANAIRKVKKVLDAAGRTLEDAQARTININLKTIDTFDRMIAAAEFRRSSILREIDRRRAAFALAIRSALKPVEEAEFTLVDQTRDQDAAG